MTMLIATHEMGFARDVADEICFLHDGRVVERGTPSGSCRIPSSPRRSASCAGCSTPAVGEPPRSCAMTRTRSLTLS